MPVGWRDFTVANTGSVSLSYYGDPRGSGSSSAHTLEDSPPPLNSIENAEEFVGNLPQTQGMTYLARVLGELGIRSHLHHDFEVVNGLQTCLVRACLVQRKKTVLSHCRIARTIPERGARQEELRKGSRH
jgi:hypothetical protein